MGWPCYGLAGGCLRTGYGFLSLCQRCGTGWGAENRLLGTVFCFQGWPWMDLSDLSLWLQCKQVRGVFWIQMARGWKKQGSLDGVALVLKRVAVLGRCVVSVCLQCLEKAALGWRMGGLGTGDVDYDSMVLWQITESKLGVITPSGKNGFSSIWIENAAVKHPFICRSGGHSVIILSGRKRRLLVAVLVEVAHCSWKKLSIFEHFHAQKWSFTRDVVFV